MTSWEQLKQPFLLYCQSSLVPHQHLWLEKGKLCFLSTFFAHSLTAFGFHKTSERCALLGREAFAAWLPFWGVPFSYAVAVSYVLTDTADKGGKAYRRSQGELASNAELHPEVNISR